MRKKIIALSLLSVLLAACVGCSPLLLLASRSQTSDRYREGYSDGYDDGYDDGFDDGYDYDSRYSNYFDDYDYFDSDASSSSSTTGDYPDDLSYTFLDKETKTYSQAINLTLTLPKDTYVMDYDSTNLCTDITASPSSLDDFSWYDISLDDQIVSIADLITFYTTDSQVQYAFIMHGATIETYMDYYYTYNAIDDHTVSDAVFEGKNVQVFSIPPESYFDEGDTSFYIITFSLGDGYYFVASTSYESTTLTTDEVITIFGTYWSFSNSPL